jgi:hypothetical protein
VIYVPDERTMVETSLTASERSDCAMVEPLDLRVDNAGVGFVGVFLVCLMFHLRPWLYIVRVPLNLS